MRTSLAVLALVALVGAAAAQSGSNTGGNNNNNNGGSGGGSNSPPPPPAPKDMRVSTFNAGLVQTVPYSVEREGPLMNALATEASNTDVLCVQELFKESQIRAAYNKVKSQLPYFATAVDPSGPAQPMPKVACSDSTRLAVFATCAANNCQAAMDTARAGPTIANGTAAVKCMAKNCAAQMLEMNSNAPACYACIFATAANGSDVNYCATAASKLIRWDSSYGVAIFSRYKIDNVLAVRMPTFMGVRAAMVGKMNVWDSANWGTVGIACAHLSSNHTGGYFGVLGNWIAEQREQLKVLNDRFLAKGGSGGGFILAGDLNTGPELSVQDASGNNHVIQGENAINYAELTGTGGMSGGIELKSYFEAQAKANQLTTSPCTFCGQSNKLHKKAVPAGTNDVMIDHILASSKLAANATATTLILNSQTSFTASDGQTYSLSDHYGVRTTFRIHPQPADKENAAPSTRAITATSVAGLGAISLGMCWAADA